MIRAIVWIAWLAALALPAAGYSGYGVGLTSPGLPMHVETALVTIALVGFADLCLVIYLLGTGRLIDRAVAQHGLATAGLAAARRAQRQAWPVVAAAGLLGGATFAGGWMAAEGALPGAVHGVLFLAATAAQATGAFLSGRALGRVEPLIRAMDSELADRSEAPA